MRFIVQGWSKGVDTENECKKHTFCGFGVGEYFVGVLRDFLIFECPMEGLMNNQNHH